MSAVSPQGPHVKIVAHKADGTLVKGFTVGIPDFYRQSKEKGTISAHPKRLEVQLAGNGKTVDLDLQGLKAVFFVKSFDGQTEYNEIKFFKAHPLQEGLWVRVEFRDKESTEGVIYNSLHYLVSPGFFLKPPDPHSNNEMVYVMKDSLADFRILGVRNNY